MKNGKVKVKLIPQMAILNENYYSKFKVPPIKSVLSVLKSHGYSNEFIQSMKDKHKKRNKLIEVKWKKLEKLFDKTSTKKKKSKKKEEIFTEDVVEDEDPEEKKDDEPEEDEAIVVDEDDEEEVVEEDYVSDGGDD